MLMTIAINVLILTTWEANTDYTVTTPIKSISWFVTFILWRG